MIEQNIRLNPIDGVEPMHLISAPPSMLSGVQLRSGEVKLFNLQVKLDLWQIAGAIPSIVQSSMSFAFIISTDR